MDEPDPKGPGAGLMCGFWGVKHHCARLEHEGFSIVEVVVEFTGQRDHALTIGAAWTVRMSARSGAFQDGQGPNPAGLPIEIQHRDCPQTRARRFALVRPIKVQRFEMGDARRDVRREAAKIEQLARQDEWELQTEGMTPFCRRGRVRAGPG